MSNVKITSLTLLFIGLGVPGSVHSQREPLQTPQNKQRKPLFHRAGHLSLFPGVDLDKPSLLAPLAALLTGAGAGGESRSWQEKLLSFSFAAEPCPAIPRFIRVCAGKWGISPGQGQLGDALPDAKCVGASFSFLQSLSASSMPHEGGSDASGIPGWMQGP